MNEEVLFADYGIRPAEYKVMKKLCTTGALSKQIGADLFIEEKTVKFHLTNIYKKMRVRGCRELMLLWWRHELREAVKVATENARCLNREISTVE